MEKITEQVNTDKTKSMLQMKRPLLPIEEYAKREGVSPEVIEECAELGQKLGWLQLEVLM